MIVAVSGSNFCAAAGGIALFALAFAPLICVYPMLCGIGLAILPLQAAWRGARLAAAAMAGNGRLHRRPRRFFVGAVLLGFLPASLGTRA